MQVTMAHNIRQWQEEDRPREKMIARGCGSLTAAELIAILFRSGNSSEDAVSLARRALALADNSLSRFSRLSFEQLSSIPGIGRAKALSVIAAAELGRRTFAEGGDGNNVRISGPQQVMALMRPLLCGLDHEECWILFLNNAGKLISKECISAGGINATVVDTRIIVRKAIEKMATAIILVHNHPSGNPRPGQADIVQTGTLYRAARSLDITLMDHVIVAGDKYFSFSDENVNFASGK